MIIPNVFQEKDRPTLDETVIDLMESIAQEELALSNLINSEAEKINAFVGKKMDFPSSPTSLEILEFNHSVNKIMDTVLMKEWLLLRKLETVVNIKSKLQGAFHEEAYRKSYKPSKHHSHYTKTEEFSDCDCDCDEEVADTFTDCECNCDCDVEDE